MPFAILPKYGIGVTRDGESPSFLGPSNLFCFGVGSDVDVVVLLATADVGEGVIVMVVVVVTLDPWTVLVIGITFVVSVVSVEVAMISVMV